MNILVFDESTTLCRLVRSLLRAEGHGVSVTSVPEEAASRLGTSLFDAVVLGPAGAPKVLADYIEGEFPRMPVVLAGVLAGVERGGHRQAGPAATADGRAGQIVAVLPAPLSAHRLVAAFRRLERDREERIARMPVAVAAEGVLIACRLADLTPETMLLAGESDEFHRCFPPMRPEGRSGAASPGPVSPAEAGGIVVRRVAAIIRGTPVEGEVASVEIDPPRRIRRVGVRIEGDRAREILAMLLK